MVFQMVSGWLLILLGFYLVNFGIFESSFFNWRVSQIASYLFKGYWIVSGWFPHIWQIKMLLILFPWIINYLCTLLLTYFFILYDTNLLLPCDIMENSQRGGFQKKCLELIWITDTILALLSQKVGKCQTFEKS